jgi:hypothetical protein
MNAEDGPSQTTEGVWMSIKKLSDEQNILVFDIEGTDSKERGD